MVKEHIQMQKHRKKINSYWIKLLLFVTHVGCLHFKFSSIDNIYYLLSENLIRLFYFRKIRKLVLEEKQLIAWNAFSWEKAFFWRRWQTQRGLWLRKHSDYDMLSPITLYTKKEKKKKTFFFITVRKTKNNFFFTLIKRGKVICWCTAGVCGIKTKKLKKARETFRNICTEFVKRCKKKRIRIVSGFYLHSISRFEIDALIRIIKGIFWKYRIKIKHNLWFYFKKAHNGVRKKKEKRL